MIYIGENPEGYMPTNWERCWNPEELSAECCRGITQSNH